MRYLCWEGRQARRESQGHSEMPEWDEKARMQEHAGVLS